MMSDAVNLPELELADRTPVPRGIVEYIQRLILKGGLKAGQRLPSQRELAEQLGVSRPSVREALTVLETMGLADGTGGQRGVRRQSRCAPAAVALLGPLHARRCLRGTPGAGGLRCQARSRSHRQTRRGTPETAAPTPCETPLRQAT